MHGKSGRAPIVQAACEHALRASEGGDRRRVIHWALSFHESQLRRFVASHAKACLDGVGGGAAGAAVAYCDAL